MSRTPTRRVALAGGVGAGVAGLLGVGTAPASAAPATPATPAIPAPPTTLTTVHPVPTGGVRGRPSPGDTLAHRLDLLDPGGEVVGEVVVTGAVLAVRGPAGTTSAVHHHLLRLPGGSLSGHGVVDLDGHGAFVVVGGTGAHRGATGSYLLRPGPGRGSTLTWET